MFESQSTTTVRVDPDCVPDLRGSKPLFDRNVIVPSACADHVPESEFVSVPVVVGERPRGSTHVVPVIRVML